jgi:hypothetical protein
MVAEHTVKAFDDDITRLRGLVAEMGGLAELSIAEAMDALVSGNEEMAAGVIARDRPDRRSRKWTACRSECSPCARRWPTTCVK